MYVIFHLANNYKKYTHFFMEAFLVVADEVFKEISKGQGPDKHA